MGNTVVDGGLGIPLCIVPGTPENEAREAGFIERPASEQLLLRLAGEERVRWQSCCSGGEERTLDA